MHHVAAFYESSWRNEGSDFSSNGEQFVLQRLAPADFRLAIDVGANLGEWSHTALKLWPNCRVHAFEVAAETYKQLVLESQVLVHNGRAECHSRGLSDQAEFQTMYYFPDHPQLTCDLPRHESYQAIPFQAEVTTLDLFCRERRIDAVDFLKIDVEGAEHRVLKGARDLLKAEKISCIQFEYGAFSIQTRFLLKDYYDLLSDQFYIGKIFPNYVAFGEYDWTTEDFRFSNYVCVIRNRPDLFGLLH
jgi:FkbM family methyltransferase